MVGNVRDPQLMGDDIGQSVKRPGPTAWIPTVSVIIPTYHRPEQLRSAVASALAQSDRPDWPEVVVALSDPDATADRCVAAELKASDPRVRVALARRSGPAAARNAGVAAASGEVIAFLDDDCVAQPGWIDAGVAALDSGADLVQGHTRPDRETDGWTRSIRIDHLTWFWEACNLFVRRQAFDRGGPFNEGWNPTGRVGKHWGEDIEWGSRIVRHGARVAYAEGAVVHHAVEPWSYWGWLRRRTEIRWLPLALRYAPELRQRRFHRGYFLNPRHVALTTSAAFLSGSAAISLAADRRLGRLTLTLGLLTFFSNARGIRSPIQLRNYLNELPRRALSETVEFASLAYGSVRWRRILL